MIQIEQKLEHIELTVAIMSDKTISMHQAVMDILKQPNKDRALQIIQADEHVNHLEEEINDDVIESLALLAPVAHDLRRAIAAIKIASELERIADYAKNIAIYFIRSEQYSESINDEVYEMEKQLIEMLTSAIMAYQNHDTARSFEIAAQDETINAQYMKLKQMLHDADDISMMEMLRNVERFGDHVKNICEHIIYMVKGQHYDFG